MRLICLNAWGGRIFEPFMEFIKGNAHETDIFCFQEVFNSGSDKFETNEIRDNLFLEIQNILVDFEGYFALLQENWGPHDLQSGWHFANSSDFRLPLGQAVFIKKSIKVKTSGDFFVFRERNSLVKNNLKTFPRSVQFLNFYYGDKEYTVCNFQGIHNWPKIDTPDRIEQSQKISDFLKNINHSKILCGDFNLQPDTKSFSMLKENMFDLIKDFNVKTTRSSIHPFNDNEGKLSDYILVSPDIKVKKFEVPNIAISDHLPLILDFD